VCSSDLHPETLWDDNPWLSPDYPGHFRAQVRARGGGEALFFSGPLGAMLTPNLERGRPLADRVAFIERLGDDLAQLTLEQLATADATYLQLAGLFPQDQRPLLGLAMLRHDQGDAKGAQEALAQARLRTPNPDKPDPRLDKLAASWGLEPLRSPSANQKSPKPPVSATEPRTP